MLDTRPHRDVEEVPRPRRAPSWTWRLLALALVVLAGCDADALRRALETDGLLEPDGDRAEVLWTGTFDEGDWPRSWGAYDDQELENAVVEVAPPRGHGNALRVYNPGGGTNGTRWGFDGRFGFRNAGIADRDEAYLRYYVWFPTSYEWDTQGKMPGLQGVIPGESPWLANESVPCSSKSRYAGETCHDDRQFGTRTMWKSGGMITYLNVRAIGATNHNDLRTDDGRMYSFSIRYRDANGAALEFKPGWNYVEQHVKLNTPGLNDGVFEGWLNGVRGIRLTNVQYRTTGHSDLRISQWNLVHFWGGPATDYPERAKSVFYDDFAISGSPIGARTTT